MADSEEDCDLWRNRDKYPKEREPSEKKASPSPVDQKTEKRPFNSYQSPSKSVEPPFKRQRNNFGDDSGCNNVGSGNINRREGFDNRRDNFNNRRDSFDNRKDSFDNRKDSFDNRKDSFDNRKETFDNRKNTFDNRNNFDNRRDGYDNMRENFDIRTNVSIRPVEEVLNYPTQPQMLLFKHFLQQQEDDIEMQAAMEKYNEYKDSFLKKQLRAFFDAHSSQEWFREKYFPSFQEENKAKEAKNILRRREIFSYLSELQWFEKIKLHVDESDNIVRLMDAVIILLEGGNANDLKILDSRRYRSESPNDTSVIGKIVEGKPSASDVFHAITELVAESVDIAEEKKKDEPRSLHKTFSIFLRNLHPNVLRAEIEDLVKPYAGFLRLALQDPTPDRKFFRRGWVTYDRTVNIKEICWNLNNVRLHDCDIGAIVNRELTQRVRPVNVLTNHKPVMRQDIKLAAKLVAKFDKRHRLWQTEEGVPCKNPMASGNPLLSDITEYLVDEGSYEEEALLGGNLNCNLELASSGSDPLNINIEIDDKLVAVLDKLLLYLRFVHSYDYYSNTEYQIEDEMPHRCGIMHARGAHIFPDKAISQTDVEEYIRSAETKAEVALSAPDGLTAEEAKKLGTKDLDEVVEAFIVANTQEIAQDKWLCPLSGKKFKGRDFVRKHIINKHMDKVEEARQAALFFNNYLSDVRRPQLPEHPGNRAGGAKTDVDSLPAENRARNDEGARPRNTDSFRGRRRDDFDGRPNYRANERSVSPNNRGNSGYYRNNSFGGGGNRGGQSRPRNGGGSYYARKVTSYNDLDAPADD